jgi:predicted GNAT family N-acyltransferase
MKIEFLKYKDGIDDTFRIRTAVFVEEQGVPIDEELDEIDKSATHILVSENGTPIGTARVFKKEGNWYIGRVAVLKGHRKKGVGKLMMETLIAHAKERGASSVSVHSQTGIVDFYRRLGFQPRGKVFMDASIPHIEMRKEL